MWSLSLNAFLTHPRHPWREGEAVLRCTSDCALPHVVKHLQNRGSRQAEWDASMLMYMRQKVVVCCVCETTAVLSPSWLDAVKRELICVSKFCCYAPPPSCRTEQQDNTRKYQQIDAAVNMKIRMFGIEGTLYTWAFATWTFIACGHIGVVPHSESEVTVTLEHQL